MTTNNLVAIDLGAESGRAVVGSFDGKQLSLHEGFEIREAGKATARRRPASW